MFLGSDAQALSANKTRPRGIQCLISDSSRIKANYRTSLFAATSHMLIVPTTPKTIGSCRQTWFPKLTTPGRSVCTRHILPGLWRYPGQAIYFVP
jgi:hypothetical protein